MRYVVLLLAVLLCVALGDGRAPAVPAPVLPSAVARPERVLILAFDNTSLDDLRAMPTLWQFLQDGAFSTEHHTVLPTRSAPGFAAIASGRYAARTGALDNGFFAGGRRESGFTFWETPLGSGLPFGLGPPPWAAFTAAGWDVGAVGMSPLVLQTDADVDRLGARANPEEPRAAAYRGVAIYRADGTRTFGAPNVPWLWQAVGPFPGWPLREVEYPLTATALMQEHGVRITFTYLENLHGNRGPGAYDDVLARYDAAFAAFFARLAAAGITPENSLFVVTVDEGDQLVPEGGRAVALGTYLESHPDHPVPPEAVQMAGGAAANLYLAPGVDRAAVRAALRRAPGVQAIAWGAALRAAQMAVAADPTRVPDVTVFGEPDVQFRERGARLIGRTAAPLWNHGTLGPAMERVWLALRGPGIRPGPLTTWTDHPDILATVHALLGLPTAELDGQVIVSALADELVPAAARDPAALRLAAATKQAQAPLGTFARAALMVATTAAEMDADDAAHLDAALAHLVDERDALVAAARARFAAALAGVPLPSEEARDLTERLEGLAARAQALLDVTRRVGSPAGGGP
jgi:arylsulfatase A-like enzyme